MPEKTSDTRGGGQEGGMLTLTGAVFTTLDRVRSPDCVQECWPLGLCCYFATPISMPTYQLRSGAGSSTRPNAPLTVTAPM